MVYQLLKKQKCPIIHHYLQGSLSKRQKTRLLRLPKKTLLVMAKDLNIYINPNKTKEEIVTHLKMHKMFVRHWFFKGPFAWYGAVKNRQFNKATRNAITNVKLKQKSI